MSLFNNLVQVFGMGRAQSVNDAQAMQLVKNVDDMLDESWKMLAGMKSKVPAQEFDHIESQHNQLYLTVVDVKSDIRGRQENRVFFASAAEREAFLIRMRKLLERCKIHHTDVLSASRRAHLQASQRAIESTPAPPISTQQGGSDAEWLSIVSESNSSLDPSGDEIDISLLSQSDSESSNDSQRFIATVAHIPKSALATEEELRAELPDSDDTYYRILICGNKRKRAVVVDPKPHLISTNYGGEDAERSQAEILRVGDMLMKSDPQQLEGHQVVHSYQGPSFISSFISSWGYNTMPLGGMV